MKSKIILIALCVMFALAGCQENEESLVESREDFMESERKVLRQSIFLKECFAKRWSNEKVNSN